MSLKTFRQLLHQAFTIHTSDNNQLQTELVEVKNLQKESSREKVGFSILFHGPKDPCLSQSMYRVENEQLGSVEIFLVPIGPDNSGQYMQYEAIFN
jgi:hypothetical protein